MGTIVEKYAASQYRPPKVFRNLEVAAEFRKFRREKGIQNHELAVKLFCETTGETYDYPS